jgi:hypothetical protein
MKKITLLLVVCVCILMPSVARADDGGFWDMLFHWDTKFFGYGTDFHVLCLKESGDRVQGCEEWFKNLPHTFHPSRSNHPFDFKDIKHEFDFRVVYLRSYGQRIPDSELAASDTNKNDTRAVNAWKLMGLYYYHFNSQMQLGAGAGAIPIWGDDVTRVWRGIGTASLILSPAPRSIWTFRLEESYLTNSISGATLGHPSATFGINGEWNFSATIGFDLRRAGNFNVKP